MTLDLYDKYELAPENEDIYDFIRKHGRLLSEVADQLDMDVEEFYFWLGKPLENSEKREIAKAVKQLFDYDYDTVRRQLRHAEDRRLQREHDKIKYGSCAHCVLKDGKKYTGQFRNYEGPGNQWDA